MPRHRGLAGHSSAGRLEQPNAEAKKERGRRVIGVGDEQNLFAVSELGTCWGMHAGKLSPQSAVAPAENRHPTSSALAFPGTSLVPSCSSGSPCVRGRAVRSGEQHAVSWQG